MKINEKLRDHVLGCIEGGALGDALGYVIEFDSMGAIRHYHGTDGIQDLTIMKKEKDAVISDDTQMTLFTAEGLILAAKQGAEIPLASEDGLFREMRPQEKSVLDAINLAYRDWLGTQDVIYPPEAQTPIYHDDRLHHRRAPGNTCLNALYDQASLEAGSWDYRTVTDRANNSCGCGGVMRVAPIGIAYDDPREAFYMGAQAAAITHGHDLGFIPAGLLADIISRIIHHKEDYIAANNENSEESGLRQVILDAIEDMKDLCGKESRVQDQLDMCHKALVLSQDDGCDYLKIESIGGGWTGHDAIADAIYAVLKYEKDFHKAMCVSVNHSGDSDSTGAIAGNILGAWYGHEAIRKSAFRWEILEMQDVYEDVTDRLLKIVSVN